MTPTSEVAPVLEAPFFLATDHRVGDSSSRLAFEDASAKVRHPRERLLGVRRLMGWLTVGLCVLPACPTSDDGESLSGSESSSSSGTSTSMGMEGTTHATTDTDPATDTDTDGDWVEACEGVVVDHSADCGEGCPIVTDVKVICDANGFGEPGLRVAPGADATWLATASDESAWLMEVQPDGLVRNELLPELLRRRTLSLALDLDGEPYVAGWAFQLNTEGTSVALIRGSGPDFEVETFAGGEPGGPVHDMEVGLDGRTHVWFMSDAPDGRTEAIRAPDGTWDLQDAPVPGTSGWEQFTVDSHGDAVAFDFVENDGDWYLTALVNGEAKPVGSSYGDRYPGAYVHISPPPIPTLDVDGPDYIVASEAADAIRVAWPTADGSSEFELPGTEPFVYTCDAPGGYEPGSCPKTCEEQGSGVEPHMFAVARTSDGRVWAAWMRTQRDQTLTYQETCDEEIGCYCNNTVEREDSSGEIVVAELDLESLEAHPVLRLSDKDPALFGLFNNLRESARALDMRPFGQELALGVRVRETDRHSPGTMRVLRVDTGLIAAIGSDAEPSEDAASDR